ncbi:MAG: Glucose-6-phosphate isomerase [uncultured Thermomicrobiales bacterium]|uniref:Glucose-6-phosphate isomerase n=1 Tax=uncultured Thermomicrobiales bacterium TaxID=1645740 RepID=A0A6J4UMR1_9BACT|nr:MAG: Glucose-6-phosphate isomerase [uncultured Thermomicrobiales bacterium]
MTSTATPMSSRLSIDYYNATAHAVGDRDGITDEQIDGLSGRVATEHARIHAEHQAGEQRWMNLPDDMALVEEIEAFAAEARERYTDFILVGIGGSSLGALATIQALAHPFRNMQPDGVRVGPRLFLLDNPDPEKVRATLETVDLPNTLISVVSKSGQTAETMANFLVAREALVAAVGEEQAVKQIVATTDNTSGLLRVLADSAGYRTFPVPDGVDGRQTVLSAVGLLPAALAGVDIRQLLAGAAAMRAATQGDDIRTNPAYLLAAISYLADTEHGKSMLVTMPYADALYGLADWFRQLWAESLGKRLGTDGREVFAGQTPIKALGAIDQHSQIQLYTEGPNDKLIALVRVGGYRSTVAIPNPPAETPELSYLANGELGQLLDRELSATAWALREAKRPNLTITTPTIDAFALGEFFYLHQLQTVMAGALYGVNPFGQPGVEAGKNATYALMGREGYEQLRTDLTQSVQGSEAYRLTAAGQG